MTNAEIDMIIDWCRKKIEFARNDWNISSSANRIDGYEKAMHAVMSYMHSMKKEVK